MTGIQERARRENGGREAAGTRDLQARILLAAIRLFADRGYGATSIREVVEAAGCTKPALYYYFDNKEALFLEAIRSETDLVTAIIETDAAGEGSVRERMKRGLHTFLDHVREAPKAMLLLQRAEFHPEEGQPSFDFDSVRCRQVARIRELLDAGCESGEVRADVDLEDATLAIVAMVEQRVQLWLRGGSLPEDLPERLLRVFFRGVAP